MEEELLNKEESLCLLCLKSCSPGENVENSGREEGWRVIGAGNNVLLQKHLQQMFVLRKILNVPVSWCENALRKFSEESFVSSGERGSCGRSPEEWFKICGVCVETVVKQCWELDQKILQLQGQMEEIKGRIKDRLREEVVKRRRRLEGNQMGGIENQEIYGLLFPAESTSEVELLENLKLWIKEENLDSQEAENFSDCSYNVDHHDFVHQNLSSDSDSSYCSRKGPGKGKRRGPGRPPTKKGLNLQPIMKRRPGRPPTKQRLNLQRIIKRRPGRPPTKQRLILQSTGKRRPGRPPKKPKEEGTLQPVQPQTEQVSSAIPSFPSIKRPRGRPPLPKSNLLKLKRIKIERQPKKDPWFRCSLCPSKFLVPEVLNSHLEAHKICNEFTCPDCSFPALSADELEHHKRTRHSSTGFHRPCSECPFIGSVRKLKAHMLENHPDVVRNSRKTHLCSICSKLCSTKNSLCIHQRKMHPEQFGDVEKNVQCTQCGLIFPSRIRLQYHLKNTHLRITKYICDICGTGFSNENDLKRHSIKHKKKEKGDYICATCGLDFNYSASLSQHNITYHASSDGSQSAALKSEDPDHTPKLTEEFQCKYCDVKSPFKVVIVRHMKTHLADMGHGCNLCGRFYTSEQGLKRHLKINHDEQNKVSCPHCMKEFQHVEYLKAHQNKFCPFLRQEITSDDSNTILSSLNNPS